MNPHWTWWQQVTWDWFGGWFRNWRPPVQDNVVDVWADRTAVRESVQVDWPKDLDAFTITPTTPDPYMGTIPGMPLQLAHPTHMENWTCVDPWAGNEVSQFLMPVPVSGFPWIEGWPNIGGAHDRHMVIANTFTGEVTEVIQARTGLKGCQRWGVWKDGMCVKGRAVTKAGSPLHGLMYTGVRGSHRLGIALTNYRGGDGDATWDFPMVGDVIRLSDYGYAQLSPLTTNHHDRAILSMLNTHGAVIFDRGGHNGVLYQAGVWPKVPAEMKVPFRWMEKVTD